MDRHDVVIVEGCKNVDFEVENRTGRMRREAWTIAEDVDMLFVVF